MKAERLLSLATRISGADVPRLRVVAGFDAFLDELTQVVGSRSSPEAFVPMRSLREFGAWAAAASGRSGLREVVVTSVSAGGCALNLGDGLAALGFPVTACLGTGAKPHPAFEPAVARFSCRLPFPCEPGRTAAYEFEDGKLMLCSVSHFAEVTPERLRVAFRDGALRSAVGSAAGLVLASWSVYPHMTECWRFLQEETFADLPGRPCILIDLADPASRTSGEIAGMAGALCGFERVGRVLLSLNENEAERVASALGLASHSAEHEPTLLAAALRERLGVSEVGIHRLRDACLATAAGVVSIQGPYCASPRRTVGAGDRFNAGLMAGMLIGLEDADRLVLASASSGFFVREARSGTLAELAAFLGRWASDSLDA